VFLQSEANTGRDATFLSVLKNGILEPFMLLPTGKGNIPACAMKCRGQIYNRFGWTCPASIAKEMENFHFTLFLLPPFFL
jgi:hypothetical protein